MSRLGWILWVNGKTEEAAWLAERIEAYSPDADPWDLAHAFLSLGNLLYESGLDEAAEVAFTRSLEFFHHSAEKHGAVFARSKLALLNHKKGEFQKAEKEMMEALEAARQSIDLYVIAYCVDDAAQLAAQRMAKQNVAQGWDLEKIVRVLGAVDHWKEILGMLRAPRENSTHLKITESLRRRMEGSSYLRAWKEGQSIPTEKVIREATELLEILIQERPEEKGKPEVEGITIALTERERQVIGLVAEGFSNQEIAERLFIAERTVRFHVTSIFNKIGADNRTQAVAIANRLGML